MQRSLLVLTTIFISIVLISCGGSGNDTILYDVSVTVSPDGTGAIAPSADSAYEKNETVNLQAQPNSKYLFTGWSGDVESSENPLTLTVDKAYALTAHFEIKTYELAVTTEGEGTVSEQVVEPKAKEYEHGTVIELTATPAEGYRFVEWSGDLNSTDNPAQITVDTPKEVTANFESLFYFAANRVTILCPEAGTGESGTVDGVTYTKRRANQITPENAATTCTSGITSMRNLFKDVTGFNGDISHWDVSSVTDMSGMFWNAIAFNQDLSEWDVSGVKSMWGIFFNASGFNREISSWDVGSVENMSYMFYGASNFNQDLSGWDVSSVVTMKSMFGETDVFNGDLSSWDVSGVKNMSFMFVDADIFNGNITGWDVSSVTEMRSMFKRASSFNRDLSEWDVSGVTIMNFMFYDASNFNQDLSGWCVTSITSEPPGFSLDAPLTEAHKPMWGTCPG